LKIQYIFIYPHPYLICLGFKAFKNNKNSKTIHDNIISSQPKV